MESLDIAQLIALAAVLGFASGIRLYAVLLVVGLVGYAGWVPLPSGLAILQHPWVIGASAAMFLVEFVADKVPGVDSVWDAIQTFIRIPAGAALAAGVFGAMDSAAWTTVAAILGGSLAATSHFTKAGTRAAANTSPEPFSNVGLSVAEDITTAGLLWLVLTYPLVALALVVALVAAGRVAAAQADPLRRPRAEEGPRRGAGRLDLKRRSLLALALLAGGCTSVPLSTMWRLRSFNAEQLFALDPAHLRAAARVDSRATMKNVTISLDVDPPDGSARRTYLIPLEQPVDDPRLERPPPTAAGSRSPCRSRGWPSTSGSSGNTLRWRRAAGGR